MIVLAYRHGMRTSEVCGLKLADVDMKNNQLTIRRLKGSLKTTQPLSDHRGEPLLSEKKALRAWLAERGDHPSAYVFTSQNQLGSIAASSIAFSTRQQRQQVCQRANGALS